MEMRMLDLNTHIWTQKSAETDQQISSGNYRDTAVGQKPGEYGENAQNHPPNKSTAGNISCIVGGFIPD